jgi:hypothetical protein
VNFLAPVFDGREATLLGDAVAPENAAMASLDTLLSDCLRDAAWTRTTCLGQWQQQAIGMPDEALLRACIQRIARECPPDTTIIAPLPTPGSSVAAEPLGPRSPARVPPWLWPTVCWGLGVCGTVIALILVQIVHTHRAERRSNSLFP